MNYGGKIVTELINCEEKIINEKNNQNSLTYQTTTKKKKMGRKIIDSTNDDKNIDDSVNSNNVDEVIEKKDICITQEVTDSDIIVIKQEKTVGRGEIIKRFYDSYHTNLVVLIPIEMSERSIK